jgi:hopanoid biosynthesis associated radical SAM protein HpnH
MRYPLGLVFDSAKHLVGRKLLGSRRFPLMLTLEPLGEHGAADGNHLNATQPIGNTAMLSVEQCLLALEECDVPVVSIGGREPLEYPEIAALARAILKLDKHLFLCTDGVLIRQRLHMIPPYTNFFWNVKLDGTERIHDGRSGRTGLYREALDGIKAAKNAGFFVVVTSTIYPDTDVSDLEGLYARLHQMHVDGYAFSPHYPAQKLGRDGSASFHEKMRRRFREVSERVGHHNLMTSPIYLEYLRGERELACSVWSSPVYGPQGWSGPCYLQNVKFAESYKALIEETVWENYGRGLNPRCENCQCREGFETAAILGMNGKAGDVWKTLAWQFQGSPGARRERKRHS